MMCDVVAAIVGLAAAGLAALVLRQRGTALTTSDILKFIPVVLLVLVYLYEGAWVFLAIAISEVPPLFMLGVMALVYGVPLAGLIAAIWLHFVKMRYWLALLAMIPMAAITIGMIVKLGVIGL